MIYEIRTYRLKTGSVPAYLKHVNDEGIAIQSAHLGHLIGYFFSEIGPLNQIVHIWAYQDLMDREVRRKALMEDARWREFLPKIQPLIEEMESKIMRPAEFSPLR
jgi:hypothetical protein